MGPFETLLAALAIIPFMACIAEAMTEAWREAELLKDLRESVHGVPFFGRLMSCAFCLSAWCIAIQAVIAWGLLLVLGLPGWSVATLLAAAPAWRASHLIHDWMKMVEARKVVAQNSNIEFLLKSDPGVGSSPGSGDAL